MEVEARSCGVVLFMWCINEPSNLLNERQNQQIVWQIDQHTYIGPTEIRVGSWKSYVQV